MLSILTWTLSSVPLFSKNLLFQAHLAAVFPRNKGRDWCIEGHLFRKVSQAIVFCLDPVMGAGKAALVPSQKFYLLFHPTGLWGKSLEESCSWFAVSQGSCWSRQNAACERQRQHIVSQTSCWHYCSYLTKLILTNGCFSFFLGKPLFFRYIQFSADMSIGSELAAFSHVLTIPWGPLVGLEVINR